MNPWRAPPGNRAAPDRRGRHSPHRCPHKRTLIGTTGRWLAHDGQIKPGRADDQRERPGGRLLTQPGTPRRRTYDCLWSQRMSGAQRPLTESSFRRSKGIRVVRGGVEPPTFRFQRFRRPLDHDLVAIVTTQLTGIKAGQRAYRAIIATVPPCAT